MELYPIICPDKFCNDLTEMYYRTTGIVRCEGNIMTVSKGIVSFDTYFNIFSSGLFSAYTELTEASFEAELTGKGSIALYGMDKNGQRFKLTDKVSFCGQEKIKLSFKISDADFIYPVIQTDDECGVFNAYYSTALKPVHSVKAAIVICTYRREEYVYSNMEKMSVWQYDIPVLLIDNGGTIDPSAVVYPNCTVFRNKNYGGSGGFARGMIEAVRRGCYTHVFVMDDDISFERTAVDKTLAFLSFVKPEYSDCAVAGGMLRRDMPYFQYEASAKWENGALHHLKHGLDLRESSCLIANEANEAANYGAWWFLCMSVRTIEENGLPFPFFIKTDDIEYGLRALHDIVVINGVGVWHDPFEGKFRYYLEYYIKRNELICDAVHSEHSEYLAVKKLIRGIAKCLVGYNYNCMQFIIKAFDDFLKGPDFFNSIDEEQLNSLLSSMEERPVTMPEQDICNAEWSMGAVKKRAKQAVSLNGYLIPSCFLKKKTAVIKWACGHPENYFGYRTIIEYDPDSGLGIKRTMKRSRLFKASFVIIKYLFVILFRYKRVRTQYKLRMQDITSFEFWCRHLDVEPLQASEKTQQSFIALHDKMNKVI